MKGTGAKAVTEALKALGIKRVFGIPGIQNMELFDAFADAPFETVLTTHESSAAFMADAHARVTGELGVLAIVPGPGLTNAITGLAESLLDSSPVLALVTSVHSEKDKSFQLHEINQMDVMKPILKKVYQTTTVAEISDTILEAARTALTGEPGPVAVEIPYNLYMQSGEFTEPRFDDPEAADAEEETDGRLDDLARELQESPAVGIYAGLGAMKASPHLVELAELLQAPVATTISGRGVIPEDHPLSVGYGFGPSGLPLAQKVFDRIQTLLAVGCKYGEVGTGAYGLKVPQHHIHIDANPGSVGVNFPVSTSIIGDAAPILEGLAKRLKSHPKAENKKLKSEIIDYQRNYSQRILRLRRSKKNVTPQRFLQTLRKMLPRDAIISTDSGNHQFIALTDFPVYEPRTYLSPVDYQAMGFSIPAAISAKLARPERQVICLVGDGGFLMSAMEMVTAARLKINPIFIVFRDNALGLIKEAQHKMYRRNVNSDLHLPDLSGFAKAFGFGYINISSDLETDIGLKTALSLPQPILVDVGIKYSMPTRYFKGAAITTMKSLPNGAKRMVAARWLKRFITPTSDVE